MRLCILVLCCLPAISVYASQTTMNGMIGVHVSGEDEGCGGDLLTDGVSRHPAVLMKERVGDSMIPDGFIYKLTATLAGNHIALLASYRTSADGNVYPALPSDNNQVIGELRAMYSPVLAQTVRYKAIPQTVRDGGKNLGDEVWVTTVFDDYPFKVVVSGSRTSLDGDCVIDWVGEFSGRD